MTIKCKRCGHEWEPRTDNPKACPRCKRYDYDKANSFDNGAGKAGRDKWQIRNSPSAAQADGSGEAA